MSTYRGFVLTNRNDILVQLPADNQWGFALYSDDQCWPGGLGIASTWDAVRPEQLNEEHQERCAELAYLLEEEPEDLRAFSIDSGDGDQLAAGLSEYEVEEVAQRKANARGESVWFYRSPAREGEESTKVTPE